MIGKNKPDIITEAVLYSKKDYISEYKILKNPEPKMGSKVDEMGLEGEVTKYLKEIQINEFYKFQEEAIKEIAFGENVIIEAPTASGKTEAFLIPVIQKIKNSAESGSVFAVFVYPTKALARDQYPKIQNFTDKIGINVRVFDGDTKQIERREILDHPPQQMDSLGLCRFSLHLQNSHLDDSCSIEILDRCQVPKMHILVVPFWQLFQFSE